MKHVAPRQDRNPHPRSSWSRQDHWPPSLLSLGLTLVLFCFLIGAATYGCEADQGATGGLDGDSPDAAADADDVDNDDDIQTGDGDSADTIDEDSDANMPPECPDEIRHAQWSRIQFDLEGFEPQSNDFLLDQEVFEVASVSPGNIIVSDGVRRISILFDSLPNDEFVLAQGMAVRITAWLYPYADSRSVEITSLQGQLLWQAISGGIVPFRPDDAVWGWRDVGSCMSCFTCDADEFVCEFYDFKQLEVRLSEPPTLVDAMSRATVLTLRGEEYLAVNQITIGHRARCGEDMWPNIAEIYLALTQEAPAE